MDHLPVTSEFLQPWLSAEFFIHLITAWKPEGDRVAYHGDQKAGEIHLAMSPEAWVRMRDSAEAKGHRDPSKRVHSIKMYDARTQDLHLTFLDTPPGFRQSFAGDSPPDPSETMHYRTVVLRDPNA